jgi:hypothetical protein
MSEHIEQRLRNMANKWQDANREVFEVCRDAAEEIRVLREIQKVKNEYGSQRLVEGAD